MENMSVITLTNDQYFLLYLIMGAYFGPHLKQMGSHKSALQRYAEGLSQYNADNLAGSHIGTAVMESVYYYMLRKAQQSVVVPRPWLHHFIHGNLPILVEGSATYPQFDDLFPSKFHKHSQFGNHYDAVENIVFINNPEPYFLMPVDIERFKRLTVLEDFHIDMNCAMLHMSNAKEQGIMNLDGISQLVDLRYVNYVPRTGLHHDGNEPSNYPRSLNSSPHNASPISSSSTVISSANNISGEDLKSGMIFIPSFPSSDQWSNLVNTFKSGFALTGSAGRGQTGPVLGLMDIGESVDSYFFRVSLPGVLRDERDFSCEVERDGRVLIKGVTVTGERTIQKFSQTFEMQSQNLCPPGNFSISFKLPGPVDPKQFHGTFATDGILEGIALKALRNRS